MGRWLPGGAGDGRIHRCLLFFMYEFIFLMYI